MIRSSAIEEHWSFANIFGIFQGKPKKKSWFGVTHPILKFGPILNFLKKIFKKVSDGFSWNNKEYLYSISPKICQAF